MSLDNRIISEFQKILNSNHLAHAYLFEGGNQKQRQEMALFLAKSQFCQNLHDGLPCLECVACKTIDLNDNPDVLEINTDKRSIGVDEVKFYKESMATGATQGKTKILIIYDAEKMTPQASNNLLKFIEEPDGQVLIIFLADSKSRILPTILSRVQSFKIVVDDIDIYQKLKEKDFSDKNIKIIDATTELEKISNLENEDFNVFLESTIEWFKKAQNNDLMAFIDIQTRLKSMIDNRLEQSLFWDIVKRLFDDELSFKYELNNSIILNKDLNKNLTSHRLVQQIDFYLDTMNKWKNNVAFQACLESLTLKLINK